MLSVRYIRKLRLIKIRLQIWKVIIKSANQIKYHSIIKMGLSIIKEFLMYINYLCFTIFYTFLPRDIFMFALCNVWHIRMIISNAQPYILVNPISYGIFQPLLALCKISEWLIYILFWSQSTETNIYKGNLAFFEDFQKITESTRTLLFEK